jgi:SAM-dependent methyltransferase
MSVIEKVHGGYVHNRRVRVLRDSLAELIPQGASVLDVGCGDGLLASLIIEVRPDVEISGVDVLVRDETHVPVMEFDGSRIPYTDKSFDVVMFVDVLHHTEEPMILLREAVRVARKAILIKDHTQNGLLAGATLRFMDEVGNARHGVALPYNYWPKRKWLEAFQKLNLKISSWKKDLRLYPVPADWIFGRSLHFIGQFDLSQTGGDGDGKL